MDSVHTSLNATTSLTQFVFQHCGTMGILLQSAVDHGDFLAVAQASMPDPLHYCSAEQFAQAYQAWSLLRKFSSFPIDIDRRAVASSDFDKSEVSCGCINLSVGALPYVPGVPLARQQQSHVELARSIIKNALGKFDWEEFQMACDFSNGASTRVPRKRGNPVFKLDGRPHVTLNCRDLAVHYIWCNDLWRKYCQDTFGRESDPYSWVELIPGSRFSTVPKDSLKDRPICVEPDLNMFFQKGIGAMLKRRLRRRGIDLSDQTRNQKLAREGSLTNSLATIDLSAASDSVSLKVVELLLPEDWYQAMLITRSPSVLKDGRWRRLEKISSMGNGFTFELESLIFWALSLATCVLHDQGNTWDVSVYGDDIIIPSICAGPLIALLGTLGFQTNKNKTFLNGPFRESCGKHYFEGADVTPFKVVDPIDTWCDIYHFCNNMREWGWIPPDIVDRYVSFCLSPIPPRNRCYVPRTFGTRTGLRVDRPPRKPVYSKDHGCHVWKFHYMAEETNEHDLSGPVAYLSGMLLREQRIPSGGVEDNHRPGFIPEPVVSFARLSRRVNTRSVRKSTTTSVWSDTGA